MAAIVAGSRPRPSGSVSPVYDRAYAELIEFGQRLGLDKIVTGTEADDAARKRLCPGDRDAQARLDAADLAAAQRAEAERAVVHNTEMELLSLQYDPEAAVYAEKLRDLKRDSADTPDSFRYLVRKTGLIDGVDTFNVKACANQAAPFAEFHDPDEYVIAVARGGIVLACKK